MTGQGLLLCGDGFEGPRRRVLAHLRGRFPVVGVTPIGVKNIATPADDGPSRTPSLAWVGREDQVDGREQQVLELLDRRIAVLLDPPVDHRLLARCVRAARTTRTPIRVNAAVERLSSIKGLCAAFKTLESQTGPVRAEGHIGRDAVEAWLRLITGILPRARAWQLLELEKYADGSCEVRARLSDLPLRLRVHDVRTDGLTPALSLSLSHRVGELSLAGLFRRPGWRPRQATQNVTLSGPGSTAVPELLQWSQAFTAELDELAGSQLDGREGWLAAAQRELGLSRLIGQVQDDLKLDTDIEGPAVAAPELTEALWTAARSVASQKTGVEKATAVVEHSSRASGGPRGPEIEAGLAQLEGVSLGAMADLLRASGALPEDGEFYTQAQIISGLGAAPLHHWLIRRWLIALRRRGWVERTGLGLRWSQVLPSPRQLEDLDEAYQQLGFPVVMGRTHRAVLARLGEIVEGKLSFRELLLGDQNLSGALAAYQDNLFTHHLNGCAGTFLRDQADHCVYPLRVLELGGGAGLSTAAALGALDGRAYRYTYSDLSPALVHGAQQKFAAVPSMVGRTLDINTCFSQQGLGVHGFDVVWAANVLHNSTDTLASLRRIREALVPGGWLLFTEATDDNYAMLTAMQFLLSSEGSEISEDDPRAGSDRKFLGASEWLTALGRCGFTPQVVLPTAESPLCGGGQRLFIARAIDEG